MKAMHGSDSLQLVTGLHDMDEYIQAQLLLAVSGRKTWEG